MKYQHGDYKNKMKVKFRFAKEGDSSYFYNSVLAEKNKIHRQVGIFGIDDQEFFGNSYKATFVAEIGGDSVGFVKASGGDLTGFNYIGIFYVLPKFRRQGLGTELFKFIEKYLLNNWNAVGIDLYTIDNEPMDKLVKKTGYSLSGIYKKKYIVNGKSYDQKRWIKLYK